MKNETILDTRIVSYNDIYTIHTLLDLFNNLTYIKGKYELVKIIKSLTK